MFWDVSFARYAVEAEIVVETEFYRVPGQAFEFSVEAFAQEYGFRLGMRQV